MPLSDDKIMSDAMKIERERSRQNLLVEQEKTEQLRIKNLHAAERRNYLVESLAMVLAAGLLIMLGWAIYGATQRDRVAHERVAQQCIAAHKNWHGDTNSCE